jgi:hypothetical protein
LTVRVIRMSETEYFRGKLIPTGKTLEEFDPLAVDVYDLDEMAVEIKGKIFTVEKENVDIYDNIFKATENDDGTIDFEVKYYNGSCGFNEAIDNALSV